MDANLAVTQFSSAALVVYGMQLLKSAKWFPLLQEGKVWASRIFSAVSAVAIHTGIGYTWDPKLDASGNRHLLLAVPTLAVASVTVWHWLNQFIMQEVVYQVAANKTAPSAAVPAGPK
jgi:hypothetical protein